MTSTSRLSRWTISDTNFRNSALEIVPDASASKRLNRSSICASSASTPSSLHACFRARGRKEGRGGEAAAERERGKKRRRRSARREKRAREVDERRARRAPRARARARSAAAAPPSRLAEFGAVDLARAVRVDLLERAVEPRVLDVEQRLLLVEARLRARARARAHLCGVFLACAERRRGARNAEDLRVLGHDLPRGCAGIWPQRAGRGAARLSLRAARPRDGGRGRRDGRRRGERGRRRRRRRARGRRAGGLVQSERRGGLRRGAQTPPFSVSPPSSSRPRGARAGGRAARRVASDARARCFARVAHRSRSRAAASRRPRRPLRARAPQFDADASGYISYDEFQLMLPKLGIKMSNAKSLK